MTNTPSTFNPEIHAQLNIGMDYHNRLEALTAERDAAQMQGDEHEAGELQEEISQTWRQFGGLLNRLHFQTGIRIDDLRVLCNPVCKPQEQAQVIQLFSRAVVSVERMAIAA